MDQFYEHFDNDEYTEMKILKLYFTTCNDIFEIISPKVTPRFEIFSNMCVIVEQYENSICITWA